MNNKFKTEYYIGLLSGTSIDSIDCGLYSIDGENNLDKKSINQVLCLNHPFPKDIKQKLNQLITSSNINLLNYGELNRQLGILFAKAVNKLLEQANLKPSDITAIGFHGQTIFHQPVLPYNFSIQLGCPNTLVEQTNIPVVTDLRQRDMINGGQGAPLAPLFHQEFFQSEHANRAIINIGGIANITLLPKSNCSVNNIVNNNHYIASDIGPGNTLLDLWYRKSTESIASRDTTESTESTTQNTYLDYDKDSEFAKTGTINQELLNLMLEDDYFNKPWPKSTGREYFNLKWLEQNLYRLKYNESQASPSSKSKSDLTKQDIQRTLLELTAVVIANNILENNLNLDLTELYICGGGANNQFLMQRITELVKPIKVATTNHLGLDPNWVETGLFAWLASLTWHKKEVNLQYITGSNKQSSTLGCIYY